METQFLQFLTVAGAAGALGWVVRLLTAPMPGLHTASEVKGLKQDKADLLAANRSLTDALRASNVADAEILAILRTLAKEQADVR